MWRSLIAAAAVYAYGHPGFDGYRPGALDKPLQSFHREVNDAALEGKRALALLDGARSMRYLSSYAGRMDEKLRGGE